jgi:hypothetical protein
MSRQSDSTILTPTPPIVSGFKAIPDFRVAFGDPKGQEMALKAIDDARRRRSNRLVVTRPLPKTGAFGPVLAKSVCQRDDSRLHDPRPKATCLKIRNFCLKRQQILQLFQVNLQPETRKSSGSY